MYFKREIHFQPNVICVSPQSRQLERMEVLLYRAIVMFCVATISVAQVCAQAPTKTNSISPSAAAANVPRISAAIHNGDLDNRHKIRAGDKLSFRVDEDQEEAKSLPVTDSGEIELPSPFGRFTASGKTCKELAQEIKDALERDYYKRATVHLGLDAINNVRGQVLISGIVAKPGPVNIPVNAPLKLSQAILVAGPTQWSKLSEVKVVRQKGRDVQTIVVDVGAILNKGKLDKDIILEPDDFVIVPERGLLVGGAN
jgi:polysaccharide biosynthesis/export protein